MYTDDTYRYFLTALHGAPEKFSTSEPVYILAPPEARMLFGKIIPGPPASMLRQRAPSIPVQTVKICHPPVRRHEALRGKTHGPHTSGTL